MGIVPWHEGVSLDSKTGASTQDGFHGDGIFILLAAASRLELTPMIEPYKTPDAQMKIRVGLFVMETCPACGDLTAI
jgi:hypothetical protein